MLFFNVFMANCERLVVIHVARDSSFGVEHIGTVIDRVSASYEKMLNVQRELRDLGNFPYVSDFFKGTIKSRLPVDVAYSLADLVEGSLVEFPLRHN